VVPSFDGEQPPFGLPYYIQGQDRDALIDLPICRNKDGRAVAAAGRKSGDIITMTNGGNTRIASFSGLCGRND